MDNNKKSSDENMQKEMLDYLQDKYGQSFAAIEYVSAKRGFNDSMNESILVAQSAEGFLVNVRSRVKNAGEFYDNYSDSLASWVIDNKIDYSSIKDFGFAKTYVTLYQNMDDSGLQSIRNDIDFLTDCEKGFSCLLAIKAPISDGGIEAAYELYRQVDSLNGVNLRLQVAFSASGENTEKYVNNYPFYGTVQWQEFDSEISNYALISESGLNPEQFSDLLLKWEDKR